jgi:RNA polymerase sigma factor (sigma-70 family)
MVNGSDVKPDQELLLLLDPDPVQATSAYENLLRRLVKYFEWRKCESPVDLAHEVLIRAVRRIQEGVTIEKTPIQFLYGVARNVYRETRRPERIDRRAVPPDDVPDDHDRFDSVETGIWLRQVLKRLSSEERELLVRYHLSDRMQLQEELGVTAGALRVRIHRLQLRIQKEIGDEAARFRKKKK